MPAFEIPQHHPRLLGTREQLVALAKDRPERYARVKAVAYADGPYGDSHDDKCLIGTLPSMGLVSVIENDAKLARRAVGLVNERYLDQPIRLGHVRFGGDVAFVAIVYDLCHDVWTEAEKQKFFKFMTDSRELNRGEEPSVFHNGWYGYKMWGFCLGAMATWHENSDAERLLTELDQEIRERASPGLEFCGKGGAFAEGYYIHYWIYEWLFFCECARRCAGVDYFPQADGFYRQRAVSAMFESFPPTVEQGSRRPVPMGDGGGRTLHHERDKSLAARLMLVNYYRDDLDNQAVNAFNRETPEMAFEFNTYKDFLFRDDRVPAAPLKDYKLSHFSEGAGYTFARSSWEENATHLSFHAGRRFTAHQHLDNGHFTLFRKDLLLGDGGDYDSWTGPHVVNYYLRSIAHNTILVHDPSEKWPDIRLAKGIANDGGQRFPGFKCHHNSAALDVENWMAWREEFETAETVAYRDETDFCYVAGDCTKAYSAQKLKCFTRQLVMLRPDVVIVFDRVEATDGAFEKTFNLQAMEVPEKRGERLVVTNGPARLFVQTLLPAAPEVALYHGERLHEYHGQRFDPEKTLKPSPKCRIAIRAPRGNTFDCFLHVLTAADAGVDEVASATVEDQADEAVVTLGEFRLAFAKRQLGGWIEIGGRRLELSKGIHHPRAV